MNSAAPWVSIGGIVFGMQATDVTPAGQRGGGAGVDRLVLLVARLAEVDVDVDQAGADDQPRGVDDDLGLDQPFSADGEDPTAARARRR